MRMGILFAIVLSAFLVVRYFSFVIMRLHLYSLRDVICINRFKVRHKKCETAVIFYYVMAMLVHLWGCVILSSYVFKFVIPVNAIILITGIITGLMVSQTIYRFVIENKYGLGMFYNDVISGRKMMSVVGADNDHEVNYIRIYDEFLSEKKWIILWGLYIIFLCIVFTVK
jgi:hypothetical protein